MSACSPVKWHRGHTAWFFDTFALGPLGRQVTPEWSAVFNSYYDGVAGPRHAQGARGLLSRPSALEVGAYRAAVDGRMLEAIDEGLVPEPLLALGLAHEEQHQELILTDILHAFSRHPWLPAAIPGFEVAAPRFEADRPWLEHPGGLVGIGHDGPGFAFDNEGPRHRVWLEPFALAPRPVTIGEWAAFAEDGGYERPTLWLSEGWDWVAAHHIDAPEHTRREGGAVVLFTLGGEREAHPAEPVRHLSYFEADALARWLGARLPTEAEWEAVASRERDPKLFGAVWEWTSSAYAAYPGYRTAAGALGEYNGKFMVHQHVLRGGSCFTPRGHARVSYRNFWHPNTQFQMTGARLARDA